MQTCFCPRCLVPSCPPWTIRPALWGGRWGRWQPSSPIVDTWIAWRGKIRKRDYNFSKNINSSSGMPKKYSTKVFKKIRKIRHIFSWCRWRDLNFRLGWLDENPHSQILQLQYVFHFFPQTALPGALALWPLLPRRPLPERPPPPPSPTKEGKPIPGGPCSFRRTGEMPKQCQISKRQKA